MMTSFASVLRSFNDDVRTNSMAVETVRGTPGKSDDGHALLRTAGAVLTLM
jgi:hypothetical protein